MFIDRLSAILEHWTSTMLKEKKQLVERRRRCHLPIEIVGWLSSIVHENRRSRSTAKRKRMKRKYVFFLLNGCVSTWRRMTIGNRPQIDDFSEPKVIISTSAPKRKKINWKIFAYLIGTLVKCISIASYCVQYKPYEKKSRTTFRTSQHREN